MPARHPTTLGLPLLLLALAGCTPLHGDAGTGPRLPAEEHQALLPALGEKLFFDTRLSSPPGQACASCHVATAGFAEPNRTLPVSRGVFPDRFGNRNTPTTAYAAYTPTLHLDTEEGIYVGGFFLDGRAASLEDQAGQPLLNPVEMANPDAATVVNKVREADYAPLFDRAFGAGALADDVQAFARITQAIAAFERTTHFSPFNSKYDAYLAGKADLTEQERRGLELFEAEDRGNCAACHPSRPSRDGTPPLFTDHTYDNLGVPANAANPFYSLPREFNPAGRNYVDLGLGHTTGDPEQNGKFKVPTLRNIAITAPYMHNGVFQTLREVMDFYNTRDVRGDWPPPEVAENMNKDELGDLGLSDEEIDDLIAFLKTLTDGYPSPRLAGHEDTKPAP